MSSGHSNIRIRIAQFDDFGKIFKLVSNSKISSFGYSRRTDVNAKDFFRNYSTHRLICLKHDDPAKVVAYAETRTYPDINALPTDCTMALLKAKYCINLPLCGTNTLFLNYLVCLREYTSEALQKIFSEIFFRENQLRFILVVEPPLPLYSSMIADAKYLKKRRIRIDYFILSDYETVYYPRVFSALTCSRTQKVHLISRDKVIPIMKYRLALPEDNDELIDIINVDRPELRVSLGDYFIAEELLKEGSTHSMIVVCEIQNITSGFIWLNDNVDILATLENYETESFGNLIKFNPEEPHQTMQLHLSALKKRESKHLFTHSAIEEIFESSYLGKFLVQSELSAHTLSSQFNLRVTSISGLITTSNERFYLREELYKRLQKLSEKLRSSTHYSHMEEQTILFSYNVPARSEDEFAGIQEHPPDAFPNAVALQLFGMLKIFDYRRIYRILLATFSAFPDREYVLLSVPEGTKFSGNLREVLKYFIQIPPRPRARIRDMLYIAQRTSIYSEIIVHDVREKDVDDINRVLKNLRSTVPERHWSSEERDREKFENDMLFDALEDIFGNPFSQYKFLIIRCGSAEKTYDENAIIGFIILRPITNTQIFAMHYERLHHEEWQNNASRAEILLFRLNDFFHFHSDLIFREISRLSEFTDFYYIQPLKGQRYACTNDMVLYMQPIEPLRYKNFCSAHPQAFICKGESDVSSRCFQATSANDHFALYRHNMGTTKILGSKKLIVIVGFSALCQAFLRLMIFNWNVNDRINATNLDCCLPDLNIAVIVEHGTVEAAYDVEFNCQYCDSQEDCWVNRIYHSDFIRDCTQRIDLRKYIRFISGQINKIDRNRKYVILKNGCEIYYDVLLLLCETEFSLPRPTKHPDILPANYAQINSRFDRIMVYHKLCILQDELKKIEAPQILVYGSHLRVFEFIDFLLTHGIEAKSITLVMPYQLSLVEAQKILNQPQADGKIENILTIMLSDMGVTIHEFMTFSHWTVFREDENISHVVFVNENDEKISFECDFFVNYFESYLDWHMFDVLTRSDIQMSHRNIVVDEKYCTNDPCIYAMGNYVECNYEPNHQYKFVSHMEQAQKLIQILELFAVRSEDETPEKFVKPHSLQIRLPQGYEMIKIIVPKKFLENHLSNEFSRSLVTYDGTFCRVRLNEHGIVEEIVCVSRRRMSFEFLLHFVGHHETFLNNLRARWCQEEIQCFLDYFQEPWAELILHERFPELREENKLILLPILETKINLNATRRSRSEKFFKEANQNNLHRQLEDVFLNFLRKYRNEFYCQFALPEDFPKQLCSRPFQ